MIVAVVGAGIDLAGAVAAVRGMEGAVTAFNKTRQITELREALEQATGISERIRQSVLRAAMAQIETDEAIAKFGAKVSGAVYSGLAGLEATPDMAVVLYRLGQRGYANFEGFMAEMKAAKLIDEAALTPAELLQLKDMFTQARNVVNDVVKAGKEVGLTDQEIGAFIKQMAEDKSLTVAQVKSAMANAANARPVGDTVMEITVTATAAKRVKGPLDVGDQIKAAARLRGIEAELSTRQIAKQAEENAAVAARRELNTLFYGAAKKEIPDSLKPQMARIERTATDLADKIEAVEALQRNSKSLTEEEKNFLEWRRQAWSLKHEAEEAAGTAKHLEDVVIPHLQASQVRATEELREASKDILDVLRSDGPKYRAKRKFGFDEVMAKDRWDELKTTLQAQKIPTPKLVPDHLISLDRISKMPEVNELLTLYAEASPAVKAEIRADLEALGDFEENLVAMQAGANREKWMHSWHDIDPERMKPFGYTAGDVNKMRGLEDTALKKVLEKIEGLAKTYRAKLNPPAKP